PASMPACGSGQLDSNRPSFQTFASADATTTASCVNRLSAPSAALAVAVELLIDYQIDADAAADAASHLPRCLVDNRAHGAAALAALLSRKQACRLAFIDSRISWAALLARLDCRYDDSSSSGEEAKRLSATALCHISQSERGCLAIWRGLRQPCFFRHHGSAVAESLAHLPSPAVASVPEARRSAGPACRCWPACWALPMSTCWIRWGCCLQLLAFGDSTTKRRLLELDVQSRLAGCCAVVTNLRQKHRRDETCWLRGSPASLPDCRAQRQVGRVIRAAVSKLWPARPARPRLLLSCLWPLRNLSNCCCFEGSLASGLIIDLLVRLTGLLNLADADTATCAAGLLCNLTCGSRPCKRAFPQFGMPFHHHLYYPLTMFQNRFKGGQAAEEFFNCDGSNALLCLLSRPVKSATPADGLPCGRPLLKASLGLCRNLVALADPIRLANDADEYDACGRRLSGGGLSDPDGGISAEEIQEVGLAFLAALSDAASAAAAAAKPEFLAALASLIRTICRSSRELSNCLISFDYRHRRLRLLRWFCLHRRISSAASAAALIGGWEYA
uniref:WAPL domain-containing protein n=1 Tax=Macrostomum lignano TaxID=282301 RepID=A0A1I8FPP6_9PLAT